MSDEEVKELGEKVHLLGAEASAELGRAVLKHAPFHSLHEGYGVICEELAEFFDEVRAWRPDTKDYRKARKELIQTAAMCLRTILDVCDR